MSEETGTVRRRSCNSIGVVLADGHPIVLEGLQHVLRAHADLSILASCTRGADVVEAVAAHTPSVVLIDRYMPREGGLALVRELARRRLSTRVVLMAAGLSVREMTQAARLGVRGVLLKTLPPRSFVQCIRQVHAGAIWIENQTFGAAAERMIHQGTTLLDRGRQLTRRELEVVRLIAEGLRNRDITSRLDIAEGTVKVHLHNIYEKFGTNDRLQLALRVRDEGLV